MNIPAPLVKLSICVNNHTGGRKGWSLCARFYEARLQGDPSGRAAVYFTDRIFWFDKNHCRKAWLLRNS